ncbi:ABC transporter permease [Micromonospora endolithica]|uniref:ABC transporter permease n=1 Tax=Micromonospora endolithica TaxID=230091 RepID=A0A3A9YZS7_9ACTN|nr:ABC transporter permease [Micromonospora endolithica]RKN41435.1 ABC transporter permease [Micromonospora endolithica]TWJ21859.1 putative ABC transport system permease protein [Micromonospora endolithica]
MSADKRADGAASRVTATWWRAVRGGPARRVRAFTGQTGLLAALALVAALLLTAAPRLSNEYADRGLRDEVTALPHLSRDLIIQQESISDGRSTADFDGGQRDRFVGKLPGPLPGLVGQRWYGETIAPESLVATGDQPPMNGGAPKLFGLVAQTGITEAADLRAGSWPRPAPGGQPTQIAVSQRVAEVLALRPGTELRVSGTGVAPLVVSGVFTPKRAGEPVWDDLRLALDPVLPMNDGEPYITAAVTDVAGTATVSAATGTPVTYSWRHRFDERLLNTGNLETVITAVGDARRTEWMPYSVVQTGLDAALARFGGQLASVRALLAVVQTGLAVSLLGLIVLAAGVGVRHRREELALLRSRGASVPTIGRRLLAESVLVLPAAVFAGWLVGTWVPGRAAGTGWLVVALAVFTTGVVAVLGMLDQRHVTFAARRQDLARARPSARRLSTEVAVVVVAVAGVVLLRRRGLDTEDGVDVFLASVPVLVAVAVALVALRVLPWPLRLLDRLAGRARGAMLFLGAARAGRGSPVTIGPLAVLIVAVSTGVFSAVVTTTVDRARDRAVDLAVPADAWLTGYGFTPDTGDRLSGVAGVDAVARVWTEGNRSLLTGAEADARTIGQARVLVVDGPAFAEVVRRSGVDVRVPAVLSSARRGDGPVPAVVSSAVAADVAGGAAADVQNRIFPFTVAAVADTFPGLGTDAERFVVLPWQALPEYVDTPVIPNRFLLAGDGIARAELLRVADDAQRERQAAVLGREVAEPEQPAALDTWQARRQALESSGANQVLTLAFLVGAFGGTALAVLAVGFAVVADARGRGRTLSRLRTMGLSGGQGRNLLVYELVPLVGAAALAGGAVGVVLPRLLGGTLGLSTFTPGVTPRAHLDPLVVGGVLGLVVLGLLAGLTVENLANRRMRLGEVLRVGEEN